MFFFLAFSDIQVSFLEKSLLNFPSVSQQRSNVLIVTWVLLHNMSAITLDWMREQSRGWDSSGNHTLRRTWSSTSLEKSWCSCNDINLLLLVQFVLFSSRSQSELKSVTAVCRALWARHTRQWEAQREEQNEMRGGESLPSGGRSKHSAVCSWNDGHLLQGTKARGTDVFISFESQRKDMKQRVQISH